MRPKNKKDRGTHIPGSRGTFLRPRTFSLKSSTNSPNPQVCPNSVNPRYVHSSLAPRSENAQPPHAPLKRSRSASSKSKTSRPRPPPGGSSWSVDLVGEPRLLVPAASPLRSRSRLSPVTNAESTAGEGRGRIRSSAQTPGRHAPMPAYQGARAPPSGPRRGRWSDLPPRPQQSVPIPPPRPPGALAVLLPAARKSFSSTDGSSFMVPDPAVAARQQSLWRRRPRGAGTGAGYGRSAGDSAGHDLPPASGCKPGWDLRGARGPWTSVCSLRGSMTASVHPGPCA